MEINVELIWALLVGLYFLFNAGRRNRAARQRQVETDTDGLSRPSAPSPFEAFVQQMEDAMRDASGEPPLETVNEPLAPEALPVPSRPSVPVRRPVPETRREFKPVGSFERERAFEKAARAPHDEHGYGPDNPFSEERFERLARGRDITEHAQGHLQYSPHGLSASPPPRRISAASRWRKRLRDPEQAQDALILTEIINGPWSPRSPRRK